MFTILQKCKKSEVLVLTPLLPTHTILKETKIKLKRNDLDFDWVSYAGPFKGATNTQFALEHYKNRYPDHTIKYVMVIDRDILPSRNMLYNMHRILSSTKDYIAFCYCNFEFKGVVNRSFKHIQYDALKLLQQNYISANSMIKLDKLEEVGGFIRDPEIDRLLDWALWLKFLNAGYYGILCDDASFIAISEKGDISTRSQEDYNRNYRQIKEKYIDTMLEGIII